eukprot:864551-Ditylum_brightwellii.AAC.1
MARKSIASTNSARVNPALCLLEALILARTLNGTKSERKRSCSCQGTGAGGPQSLTKALCRVYLTLTGNSHVIPLSGNTTQGNVVNKNVRLPHSVLYRSHPSWATYWMEMDD